MASRKIQQWVMSRITHPSRSFYLCPAHSAELRAKQDKINASLAAESVVLSESTADVGPFGIRVHLLGARCAKCFGEPPYEPRSKPAGKAG